MGIGDWVIGDSAKGFSPIPLSKILPATAHRPDQQHNIQLKDY